MVKPALTTTVYVSLLGEGVDVWRPVSAEHIREDIYRIVGELQIQRLSSGSSLPVSSYGVVSSSSLRGGFSSHLKQSARKEMGTMHPHITRRPSNHAMERTADRSASTF